MRSPARTKPSPNMWPGVVAPITWTVKLAVVVLPRASDDEQVTTVSPTGKTPDGEQLTARDPSTASFAVTGPNATDAPDAEVAAAVTVDAGTPDSTGPVVSVTVSRTSSVAWPPLPSLTVTVIV